MAYEKKYSYGYRGCNVVIYRKNDDNDASSPVATLHNPENKEELYFMIRALNNRYNYEQTIKTKKQ